MLFIIVLLMVSGLAGYGILIMQLKPVNSDANSYVDIRIAENTTATQVAQLLHSQQLIRNSDLFLAYCRHKGLDSRLKAGHYQLSPSQSLPEIAAAIAAGKVVTISFTIPEGFTVEKTGRVLEDRGICTWAEWQNAINATYEYPFLQEANPGEGKPYLEGFLFPDTYVIAEDTSAVEIVQAMLDKFSKIWEEHEREAIEQGITVYDTLIIASMIEREAMVDSEREIISGVIKNRMERNMLLQIDATVLYSLGKDEKDIVYYEDLEIDSPYNTYKYAGLPLAPIACPGQAAIHAALNPQQHDYLYYVSRGDGSHHFSKTYSEHLQAKAQYIN
ncbi:MAG: endolytic transglycosylase MltG [Syntrophomonadaceae bacterium]|nr:endolytic transglycosylase MltG [Syntrophomonadaceae bacterium]